ncbi:MAG TPA: EthD family reductase [Nitrosomonas sp.]|nr:EthD family reductase [Nitrosomonas sp.]
MIKVSVMYPYKEGARFDHDYYQTNHMSLVKSKLGPVCLYYTVDKGLAGGGPGQPPAFVGMCEIFCESVDSFQSAFAPHAKEIMKDIVNYTDLEPVIQISEVLVGLPSKAA